MEALVKKTIWLLAVVGISGWLAFGCLFLISKLDDVGIGPILTSQILGLAALVWSWGKWKAA